MKFIKTILLLSGYLYSGLYSAIAVASSRHVKEYGIIILPDQRCTKKVAALNKQAAKELRGSKNITNNWHVTLYHGAFKPKELGQMIKSLKSLRLQPFNLTSTGIYSVDNRWIFLGIKNDPHLQQLHEDVVHTAASYHQRPLKRVKDSHDSLPAADKAQVADYGSNGLFNLYNPHITIFYQYPPDTKLAEVAKKLSSTFKEEIVCQPAKIAIGELGYNGNIKKILHTIKLPLSQV